MRVSLSDRFLADSVLSNAAHLTVLSCYLRENENNLFPQMRIEFTTLSCPMTRWAAAVTLTLSKPDLVMIFLNSSFIDILCTYIKKTSEPSF